MKVNKLGKFWAAAITPLFVAAGMSAAPLAWFRGPAINPMSGAATLYNGGNSILTGGDAYQYDGLTEPISLAATNASWNTLGVYYGLNLAPGAVYYDGNLLIYGGTDGTTAQSGVTVFNLSGDMPPTMPPMKVARAYLGYAADKSGNAYAIGGLNNSGNPLSSVERLSLGDGTPAWAYVASLPAPRFNFPAVFDHTNYLYVFGGLTNATSGHESTGVLRYSVSGNSWSSLAAMPLAVAGSAATFGPDGKIYVVGGTSGGVSTNVVQVYNPAANIWTLSTPLPEGLSLAAMGVDSQGRLIVMGGVDTNGYDQGDVWRSQQLNAPDAPPAFVSYPGVSAAYQVPYQSSITATGAPPPIYLLKSGPAGMQVDPYSGTIAWTPQASQIGTNSVTIRATNYSGQVDWTYSLVIPYPLPAVLTNLSVLGVTESSVTLAWSPENPLYGPVTYGVWLATVHAGAKGSSGTVTYGEIASTTQTNITIGGLMAGSSKTYYLTATGGGGKSGYTAIGATTLPAPTPNNLRVTGLTSTTVTLTWDPPIGPVPVVSYDIIGIFNGYFGQYPLGYANITKTSFTVTGLAAGGAMQWGVAALDALGNVSLYDYIPTLVVNPVPTPAAMAMVAKPASGGVFQFTVQASTAQTTLVQATTNLGSPTSWVTIATNPPGSSFLFKDPNAGQFQTRYYRVISP